ncbi:MAG: energy transducer TonB [bacterium]
MKKSILSLFVFLTLFACSQDKHESKIIPDYEKLYLSSDVVDVPPRLGESTGKILDEKIVTAIRKVFKGRPGETDLLFDLVIYINEEGTIDGIQFKEKESSENTEKNLNLFFKEIKQAVADAITESKFTPAKDDGKNVKSRFSWLVSLNADKNGNITKTFPQGVLLMPPPRNFMPDNYNSKWDESPLPIGGMGAIVKLIVYPEDAKKSGIQGKVFVRAFIDESGSVITTELMKGTNTSLDTAAMNTVGKVKFTPAKVNGKPVKSQIVIPIQFTLK